MYKIWRKPKHGSNSAFLENSALEVDSKNRYFLVLTIFFSLQMLQNLSASEGQLVVFECRVKGAPSPKVEWYREGTLIEDSPDFRILQKSKSML